MVLKTRRKRSGRSQAAVKAQIAPLMAGYASPVRTPRGRDILAACGQLKSESEKQRASARRKAAQDVPQ